VKKYFLIAKRPNGTKVYELDRTWTQIIRELKPSELVKVLRDGKIVYSRKKKSGEYYVVEVEEK